MSVAGLPGTVVVGADEMATAQSLANWLIDAAAATTGRHGVFHIALTGGSTPATLYRLLAASPQREQIDWRSWEIWFTDERGCPPQDEQSNWNLAWRTLLAHVPVSADQIHRMEGERADLDAAAADYARRLAGRLPALTGGSAPRLGCVLLGLGSNGHVASLFPGDPSVAVSDAWAAHGRADYAPFERITLTLPTINAAAAVAFLVTGATKRPALRSVSAGSAVAARVRPLDGELRWHLDEAAAAAGG